MTARASTSSGETLTSLNSRRFLSRSTNSMVRVASRVTHSVTCGAENADCDHRAGHHLAHALDRLAPLALATVDVVEVEAAHQTLGGQGRRAVTTVGGQLDVVAGDRATRAGRGDRAQVDAEILGELAHRRLGERARLPGRQRLLRCRVGADAGGGHGVLLGGIGDLGRGEPGLEGALHLLLGRRAGGGRRRGRAPTGAAYGRALGLVATDQALALAATAGGRVGQVDLVGRGRRRRRAPRPR